MSEPTGITYVIDDRAVLDALDRIDRKAQNKGPALDAMGAHMVFSTQRNFERETSPEGVPWQRLSPRTASRRIGKRQRGHDNILRVTTRLYRSIAHAVDAEGFEWGTNVIYGRIHQEGGTITMPERKASVSLRSIRTKGGGIRTRFAKPGSRNAVARSVTVRGHTITIPARPYLGVSAQDRSRLLSIAAEHTLGDEQ